MRESEFIRIYSGETLSLKESIYVRTLYVHLGDPGPVVELAGYQLQWSKLETIGKGTFTMLRHGKQVMQLYQP